MKIQYVFGNPAKRKSAKKAKGGTVAAKKKRKGARKTKRATGARKVARKSVRKVAAKAPARRKKSRRKPTSGRGISAAYRAKLDGVGLKGVRMGKKKLVLVVKGKSKLSAKQRQSLYKSGVGGYVRTRKNKRGVAVLKNPRRRRNPDNDATQFMGAPLPKDYMQEFTSASPMKSYQTASDKKGAAKKGTSTVGAKKRKRRPSAKTIAARKKRQQSIAKGVRVGLAPRQSVSKKRKSALPVVKKGGIFKATSKKGSVLMKRRNPGLAGQFVDPSAPTIGLGSFYDTGHTKNEFIAILAAGFGAPFISAIAARVPVLQKLQAVPTYGVPALLALAGGVLAAKGPNPTLKNIGKAFVAVGVINLGGALARQVTASKGGVSGMMGDLLGYDGYEGYEGDDISGDLEGVDGYDGDEDEVSLDGDDEASLAALPAGLQGVDFTPSSRVRPFGDMGAVPAGMGHGTMAELAGVDFTPSSRVRPFGDMGEVPSGLGLARDGADFGSLPRDGADFGGMA